MESVTKLESSMNDAGNNVAQSIVDYLITVDKDN